MSKVGIKKNNFIRGDTDKRRVMKCREYTKQYREHCTGHQT